jgi:hypothetical protein
MKAKGAWPESFVSSRPAGFPENDTSLPHAFELQTGMTMERPKRMQPFQCKLWTPDTMLEALIYLPTLRPESPAIIFTPSPAKETKRAELSSRKISFRGILRLITAAVFP